jgi:hypothetical protein
VPAAAVTACKPGGDDVACREAFKDGLCPHLQYVEEHWRGKLADEECEADVVDSIRSPAEIVHGLLKEAELPRDGGPVLERFHSVFGGNRLLCGSSDVETFCGSVDPDCDVAASYSDDGGVRFSFTGECERSKVKEAPNLNRWEARCPGGELASGPVEEDDDDDDTVLVELPQCTCASPENGQLQLVFRGRLAFRVDCDKLVGQLGPASSSGAVLVPVCSVPNLFGEPGAPVSPVSVAQIAQRYTLEVLGAAFISRRGRRSAFFYLTDNNAAIPTIVVDPTEGEDRGSTSWHRELYRFCRTLDDANVDQALDDRCDATVLLKEYDDDTDHDEEFTARQCGDSACCCKCADLASRLNTEAFDLRQSEVEDGESLSPALLAVAIVAPVALCVCCLVGVALFGVVVVRARRARARAAPPVHTHLIDQRRHSRSRRGTYSSTRLSRVVGT